MYDIFGINPHNFGFVRNQRFRTLQKLGTLQRRRDEDHQLPVAQARRSHPPDPRRGRPAGELLEREKTENKPKKNYLIPNRDTKEKLIPVPRFSFSNLTFFILFITGSFNLFNSYKHKTNDSIYIESHL